MLTIEFCFMQVKTRERHILIFINTHTHTHTHSINYTVDSIGYTPRYRTQQLTYVYTPTCSVRAEGLIPVIGDRWALLPDHYSISEGALFIILIKTTIFHVSFCDALDFGHKLDPITCKP